MRLPDPPLMVISDAAQASKPLTDLAEEIFAAGCRWFSLREKQLDENERARLASKLKPVAAASGALLGLHGKAGEARGLGLNALHLPSGSDPVHARAVMGQGALLGLSLHAGAPLTEALRRLDYVTFSPVFASASKPDYRPVLGIEGLAEFAGRCPLPVIALGGVETPERVRLCREAGAAGCAVMGAVMRSPAPAEAFRALLDAWRA